MKLQHLLSLLLSLSFYQALAQFENIYPHCEGNSHYIDGEIIWQVTESGVVKRNLDGLVLATYDHSNSPIGLPYAADFGKPSDISTDSQGNVWVALGVAGVGRMTPSGDWTIWPTTEEPFLNEDRINFDQIGVDGNDVVWVSGFASNLYKFENGIWELETVTFGIQEIKTDLNGQVLIATGSSVRRLESNGVWTSLDPGFRTVFDIAVDAQNKVYSIDESYTVKKYESNLPSNILARHRDKDEGRALAIDPQGTIWTGGFYEDFASRYNGNDDWTDFDEDNSSLSRGIVEEMTFDQRGNLWLTQIPFSNDGLQRYDGNQWEAFYAGIPGADAVAVDNNDRLWLHRINVLCRWDPATDQYDYYSLQNRTFPDHGTHEMVKGRGEEMWAAINLTTGLPPDRVTLAHFDGNSWEGISSENTNLAMPYGRVDQLAVDQQGFVYCGIIGYGYRFGLSIYNTNNNTWDLLHTNGAAPQLPNNRIEDMAVNESDQKLWISNWEGGLLRYDPLSRALDVYDLTNVNGLPQYIHRVVPHQNHVWLLSTEGLGRFDWTTRQYFPFTTSTNGLQEGTIKDLNVDPQGRIWMTIQQEVTQFMEDDQFLIQQFDGTNWTTYTPDNSNFLVPSTSGYGGLSRTWNINFTSSHAWFGANIGLSKIDLSDMPICNINASTTNPICQDNGTASDPSDDQFKFVLSATGTGTGVNYLATVSNDLISNTFPISYGQDFSIERYIANGTVNVLIEDSADPSCTTSLSIPPTPTCSDTSSNGVDLEMNLTASNLNPNQWSTTTISVQINNKGNETATGIQVSFPLPNGTVFEGGNEFQASQGSFAPYGNRVWNVGSLAAGSSAELTINLFVLQTDFTVYTQVLTADQGDADSSPGNGNCCVANEDDEAVLEIGGGGVDIIPPDVNISSFNAIFTEIPILLMINFSEAVTGFGLEDFVVNNGIASDLTATGTTSYTAIISPIDAGEFSVHIPANVLTDIAGNANTASEQLSFTYIIPPDPNCLNPNYSFIIGFSGWNNFANTAIITEGYQDTNSARIGPGEGGFGLSNSIPAEPGDEFKLLAYSHILLNPEEAVIGIKFLDFFLNEIGQKQIAVSSDVYQLYELNATAPPNTVLSYAFAYKVGDTGFQYVDEMCFTRVDDPMPDEVDLEISLSANPINPATFSTTQLTLSVSNEGLKDATGIRIHFPKPDGLVFSGGNEYTASQGSYNPYGDQVWELGSLAAGQSAEIVFGLYILEDSPILTYGEVLAQDQPDADSSPGNGNGSTAQEDDEASLTLQPSSAANRSFMDADFSGSELGWALDALYPNPTLSLVHLRFRNVAVEQIQLQLFDLLGRVVLERVVDLEVGLQVEMLDLVELAGGTYFLLLRDARGLRVSERVVKGGD